MSSGRDASRSVPNAHSLSVAPVMCYAATGRGQVSDANCGSVGVFIR